MNFGLFFQAKSSWCKLLKLASQAKLCTGKPSFVLSSQAFSSQVFSVSHSSLIRSLSCKLFWMQIATRSKPSLYPTLSRISRFSTYVLPCVRSQQVSLDFVNIKGTNERLIKCKHFILYWIYEMLNLDKQFQT